MTFTDSATVHVVAYALWPPDISGTATHQSATAWQDALQARPHSPALASVANTRITDRLVADMDSACLAHESVVAQARGWPMACDVLPEAALLAAQLNMHCPVDHGWAFIDLVHGQFDQGQIRVSLPPDLTAQESETLRQAMLPFFTEDGISLHTVSPGRFLAHATVFKQLPCVSLERVCLRGMHALTGAHQVTAQTAAQRLLRRLQNEMQMLLYTHALNDERGITINSFWVSGCGDLPTLPHRSVVLHQELREPWMHADPAAWALAWQALAEKIMQPALQQGWPLVLCSPDHALYLQALPDHALQRFIRWFKPVSLVRHLS